MLDRLLEGKSNTFKNIITQKIKKEDIIQQEYDSSLMPNVKEGAKLIKETVNTESNIFIAGDFDADGVTSTTSIVIGLRDLLKKYDKTSIFFKVPTRDEGHGLNKKTIDLAKEKKCSLIITVDNGSNDKEMIEYAYSLDIRVLVTDHHEIELNKEEINYPIINPLLGYPDKYLCGVGVVYKFLQYLESLYWTSSDITKENKKKIKMLTMIGTVADMVPLKKENLYFILNFRYLFEEEYKKDTLLSVILKELEFDKDDGKFFGWKIGPFFNGPGRMGNPNQLITFLINGENEEIKKKEDYFNIKLNIVRQFYDLNAHRKLLVRDWIVYIEANKKEVIQQKNKILLITQKDIPSGLKRLVAGEYNNKDLDVVFCGSENEKGEISISAINNTKLRIIDFFKDNNLIIGGGGHVGAFGFSYKKEKEEELLEKLNIFLEDNKGEEDLDNKNDIITLDYEKDIVSDYENFLNLGKEINSFVWGMGLEEPIFKSQLSINNSSVRLLAKKHISVKLDPIGFDMQAIKWGENNLNYFKGGKDYNFNLSINKWMGNEKVQFIIKD